MLESELLQRLQTLDQNIRLAEKRYSRPPHSVSLLAVSKSRAWQDLALVYEHGLRRFGESYLQEALVKIDKLRDLEIEWHFIGPIQSNKTSLIASNFHWVQSVDRVKIAQRLNDQRPATMVPLQVCIQVNISGEANKSGVEPEQLKNLASTIHALPQLNLRGIMAIPARSTDVNEQLLVFRQLATIFTGLQAALPAAPLDTLSMGMTGDMEAAIAAGATMVRIGTGLFGKRNQ